jgi:hypothetical protein
VACLLCGLIAAGCHDPKPCGPFLGDPSLPPEATLIALAGDTVVEVAAGDPILLERPPQGGHVVYTAPRVRNVSSCNADMEGQFRDPVDGRLLGYDRRQANLVPTGDGWGQPKPPERSNFPNVSLCPDATDHDLREVPLLLDMKLTDADGRQIAFTTSVVPRCQLADPTLQALCVCECSAGYVPGKCGGSVPGDGGM